MTGGTFDGPVHWVNIWLVALFINEAAEHNVFNIIVAGVAIAFFW